MHKADVENFNFLDQDTQKCAELKRLSFLSHPVGFSVFLEDFPIPSCLRLPTYRNFY